MEGISQIGNGLFSLTTEKTPFHAQMESIPLFLSNPAPLTWILSPNPYLLGGSRLSPGRALPCEFGRPPGAPRQFHSRSTGHHRVVPPDSWKCLQSWGSPPSWAIGTGFCRQEDKWGTLVRIDTGKQKMRQSHYVFIKHFLNTILRTEHWGHGDVNTTSWPLMSSEPCGANRNTHGGCCWPCREGCGPAVSSCVGQGCGGRKAGKHTRPISGIVPACILLPQTHYTI